MPLPVWVLPAIKAIGALATVGQVVSSGVANRRSRESQATINQANIQAQKEINQQNIDLQRSAIPDKFNQLTSLGMSRGAALQAVSGASYSPSAVATTQQAYQEQPLDFSGFGTLGNMLQMAGQFDQQMAETKRMNDAQLEKTKTETKISQLELYEKEYGISAVQTADSILQLDGVTMDDLNDFDRLRKKLPDDMRKRVNTKTFSLLNQIARDRIATQSDQVALRLQLSAERLSKLKETWQKLENESKTYDALMKKIDAKDYPELSRLRIENMRNANMLQFQDYNAKELTIMLGYEDLDAKKLENELRELKTWNERNLRKLAKEHPLADAEVMLIDHLTMLLDILPLRGMFK